MTMETKELKIEVPEGFEIDKENSSFEKIVFKKKEDTKPRSWDEFMQKHLNQPSWRINMPLPSKEMAEQVVALCKLLCLRQEWIGDWKPDWKEVDYKHYICVCCNILQVYTAQHVQHPLSFPTGKMAQDFINTFKDLLEVAKPLI